MGRRRRSDLHLPKRVYQRRGKFYFDSPITEKWIPLGADIGKALAMYGQLLGNYWVGRTVGDVIDRYRAEVTPLKSTVKGRDEELVALTRLKRVFSDMLQDNLTPQHIYKYIDRRRDTRPEFVHLNRPAKTAAKHEIALLRLVLAKGIRWGVGTTNVAVGIEFEAAKKQLRDVTPQEYEAVYGMASEIMQIAMDLASNIGQRREDLLSLRWDEVNEISGTPVEQGKTGASLLIEMSPGFQSALARAWAMKPDIPKIYVLRTRKGTRYTGDGFSTIWQRLMKKAIAAKALDRPFAWKDLRAKAAQDKTDLEGIEAAQQLLGHTTPATTKKHYVTRLPPTRVKPVR